MAIFQDSLEIRLSESMSCMLANFICIFVVCSCLLLQSCSQNRQLNFARFETATICCFHTFSLPCSLAVQLHPALPSIQSLCTALVTSSPVRCLSLQLHVAGLRKCSRNDKTPARTNEQQEKKASSGAAIAATSQRAKRSDGKCASGKVHLGVEPGDPCSLLFRVNFFSLHSFLLHSFVIVFPTLSSSLSISLPFSAILNV
jgi:hypothetical protein